MNTALMLMLLATVESAVFLIRYRTATARSAVVSGLVTFAICATRISFVFIGAKAVIAGASLPMVMLAYCGTAAVATGVLHEILERRKERKRP